MIVTVMETYTQMNMDYVRVIIADAKEHIKKKKITAQICHTKTRLNKNNGS